MIVYRIEDKEGWLGPYRWHTNYIWSLYRGPDKHDRRESHPLPMEDGIWNFEEKVDYCAFESLAKLKEWFNDDEIQALEREGFVLALYKISKPKIKFGRKQVVFPKKYARLIDMKPLAEVVADGN